MISLVLSLSLFKSYELLIFVFLFSVSYNITFRRNCFVLYNCGKSTIEELFCSSSTWAADSFLQEPALSATHVPCCTLGGATGPSKAASPQFLCLSPTMTRWQYRKSSTTLIFAWISWVYILSFNRLCSSLWHMECDSFPALTFQHFDSNSLACWHLVNPKSRGLHHLPKSAMTQSFA